MFWAQGHHQAKHRQPPLRPFPPLHPLFADLAPTGNFLSQVLESPPPPGILYPRPVDTTALMTPENIPSKSEEYSIRARRGGVAGPWHRLTEPHR